MKPVRPLRVFFLWHFHQPWYPDLSGGPTRLPWVRLHALKDYADLPAILSEEPRVPHCANLVPGLLDQIEALTRGASDAYLDVARLPVVDWDEAAVDFVLENFFSAHRRLIETLPHYAELKRRKEVALPLGREALRREFSAADLRDLVVFFHLAWSGPALGKDRLLVKLRHRGHRFSEEEKGALLERQTAFLGEVIPAWKKAFASGVVEAATSPYHHPILPLLIDSSAAREANPEMPLPAPPFRHPEDARAQVALGLTTFERHFGFRPAGMWPPEGSLSERTLALLGEAGVAWVATDEEVLLRSLGPAQRDFERPGERARTIFRPWRLAGAKAPGVFFRDRVLSDRIGFSYATWSAEEAAADFVARLLLIREAAPEDELVVPVILDGENAWESYPGNGAPFLRALAAALAREPGLSVTTPSRALQEVPSVPLTRLVAGSWVNGSLATWIGAPSKNRAWNLLVRAREALGREVASARDVSPLDVLAGRTTPAETARVALFAAEASDWFWWFGEDHTSAHDPIFDASFRAHLSAAYRALGRLVPEELERPVESAAKAPHVVPTSPVSPTINGARADYFKWLGAGRISGQPRGAIHRGAGLLREVFFGAAAEGSPLFFRLDPAASPATKTLAGRTLRLLLAPPERASAGAEPGEGIALDLPLAPGIAEVDGCRVAVDRIVELAVPRPSAAGPGPVGFRLVLLDADGREAEAIPDEGWIRFRTVTGDWSA